MPRESKLQSVAHNIMDHAVSGLGFLTPHVVAFCKQTEGKVLRINLLPPASPLGDGIFPAHLEFAAGSCQKKFLAILTREGFQTSDVLSAHLEFGVPQEEAADSFQCECTVESVRHKRYIARMNSDTYWSSTRRKDPFDVLRRLKHGG